MDYTNFFEQEIILESDRARLEPLTQKYFEPLMAIALSSPDIWKFTLANITDEKSFSNYFSTALKEKENKTAYPFAMFDKKENRYAGCTRYANISFKDKRLEIGWTWIDPLLQGSGINKHNKFLMLQYAFETLELNRVELKTAGTNLKSQRAMEKIGAIREGVLRKHSINDMGITRDTVYYSFISDEWPGIKKAIFPEFIK
ncbi:MAG: GNAT family N-acetyltransferase [Chitinophagaceae bacterium]|nr:GNAT family N-acetyltransferase [Chitinophagaceae bacterium]